MYRDVNPFTEPMRQTESPGSAYDHVLVNRAEGGNRVAIDIPCVWQNELAMTQLPGQAKAVVNSIAPISSRLHIVTVRYSSRDSASAYQVPASMMLSFQSH